MHQGSGDLRDTGSAGEVSFGPFVYEPENHRLSRDGVEVPIPPRALAVLACLLERPGLMVSKQTLLDTVWKDAFVTETSLAEAVSLLRQLLGDDPQQPTYIRTVPRRGYRFIAPVVGRPSSDSESAREHVPGEVPPTVATIVGQQGAGLWRGWLPALLSFVAGVAIGVASISLQDERAPVGPLARFSIVLPEGLEISGRAPAVDVSNDGAHLAAVVARPGSPPMLVVRALDGVTWRALPHTDGASSPFFSPDNRWVAFFADGRLKKVSLDGGRPLTLCDAPHDFGGAWGDDGAIVFAASLAGGLQRVTADGGTAKVIAVPEASRGDARYTWPELLPGQPSALVTVAAPGAGSEVARVAVIDLDTGRVRSLIRGASRGRYVASGHLVFARGGGLFVMPVDGRTMTEAGPVASMVDGVATDERGEAQFALSRNGTLAWVSGPDRSLLRLAWLRPGEVAQNLDLPTRHYRGLSLAGDGSRLAVAIGDGERSDVWMSDIRRGTLTRLTTSGHADSPVLSTDGRVVVFSALEGGSWQLHRAGVDSGTPAAPLSPGTEHRTPTSVAADGRVLFTSYSSITGLDIWILGGAHDRPRPLVRSRFDETDAAFAPDGRAIAYRSNESGAWQVYLRASETAPTRAVGRSSGEPPFWSADGGTLYFRNGGALMAARVSAPGPSEVGAPVSLLDDASLAPVAAAADGRLLARRSDVQSPARRIEVVLNWSRELAARAPAAAPRALR